ncbi:MAG: hypothetical protein H6964_01515 [Chromatiaceae bacterium]|nr:hypothetical protein [Chromatiaceae bacterium]
MIKSSLEKFDTPVVIINQVFENEDWGVVASYVKETEVEENLIYAGWHVSITLPNMDDVDFEQLFSTPEAALEYGISQILSGSLVPAAPVSFFKQRESDDHPFGNFHSVA